jgi:hypothetical protein
MRIQPQSLRGSVRPGLPNNTTTTYSSTSPPAAGEQTKAAWIKMNTPATNDANQLLQAWSWFAGPGHLSGEDGWHPATPMATPASAWLPVSRLPTTSKRIRMTSLARS